MDDKALKTFRGLLDRRAVLLAGGAMTVAGVTLISRATGPRAADAPAADYSSQFNDAHAKVAGAGFPTPEGVTLELPEIAENGNIVPYRIEVESPMTADDYVAEVHLLSTANPQAAVATFHFTPQSGKAAVTGRMRLAKTQDVVALAVTSTGKLMEGRRRVEVTIGGCGTD